MSRAALRGLLTVAAFGLAAAVCWCSGVDPHMDPSIVPAGCAACHEGHGASRSPMLPKPQAEVCLSCHGSETDLNRQSMLGNVASNARPRLISSSLAKPFVHPLTRGAFSRYEPDVVSCTSCHSPHRGMRTRRSDPAAVGKPLPSPEDPARYEYELCESCHGNSGAATQSLLDLSRLLNPMNRSYHPVEAPSAERSPSVLASLSGRQINCTDCHGNDDPTGPRGPHGSSVRFLLRGSHPTVDGQSESPTAYGLCYTCHEREKVLSGETFPEHALHIDKERTTCTTCHNTHGSLKNRALIRFGEDGLATLVSPSSLAGRLDFVSEVPGSGACFLTCHGYDHAPASYGAMEVIVDNDLELMQATPMLIRSGEAALPDADRERLGPRRPQRKKKRKQ